MENPQFASDEQSVGAKAAGLARLPPAWVPPFAVLHTRRTEEFLRSEALIGEVAAVLDDRGDVTSQGSVMVRSSAPEETLADRGRLSSYESDSDARAVAAAAARIAEHAREAGVTELAIMIQRRVEPESFGHLSNERRVSASEHVWLFECHWPGSSSDRFRPRANVARPAEESPLVRQLGGPVRDALEPVARQFTRSGERLHFEWVADVTTVWIVQADVEHKTHGPLPCHAWFNRAVEPHASGLMLLELAADIGDVPWHKVRDVQQFDRLGLPHGAVHVLRDPATLQALAANGDVSALTDELGRFATWPVVVRTDVAEGNGDGLLLPHSGTLQDSSDIVAFMRDVARSHRELTDDGKLAFLLHHFVAARVGTFSYAEPRSDRVRIDATWGVPDSLLFHAHDTYEVDLSEPDAFRSVVRCKSYFVDVDQTGMWVERVAGWNLDWKRCLTPEQARRVAEATRLVAEDAGVPVQVMCFVGLPPALGLSDVLPWFVQEDIVVSGGAHPGGPFPTRGIRRTIRSDSDLAAFHADVRDGRQQVDDCALVLRPRAELLRSSKFLEDFASCAASLVIPVVIEGSVLSHAFYVLRREGVAVQARNDFDDSALWPPMPLNKLVRDGVPDLVRGRSEDVAVLTVEGEELHRLLALKAVEEAAELAHAPGDDAAVDELADLFEVVRSLAVRLGHSITDIERLANEKRDQRGGFETGSVLVSTRQRLFGQVGEQQNVAIQAHPGRIAPHLEPTADGILLRLPFRGIGLEETTRLTWELPSETSITADVRYGVHGVDVRLHELQPQPPADQLTFDLDV